MKIKLLKNYILSAKGSVIDIHKNIAELLIARKIAEIVKEKKSNNKKD